jgi:hypothetical protein
MTAELPSFEDAAAYSSLLTDELTFGDMLDLYPRLRALAENGTVQEGKLRTLMGLTPDMALGDKPVFVVCGADEIRAMLAEPEAYSNDYLQIDRPNHRVQISHRPSH